jgi:hypothetical protein
MGVPDVGRADRSIVVSEHNFSYISILLVTIEAACGAGCASPDSPPDAADSRASPEGDGSSGRRTWRLPRCDVTAGAPVTFTHDDGATLAPLERDPTGTTYTTSVIALEAPDILLAANDSNLFRSVDSGCTWSFVGQVQGDFIELVPGVADRAYGWSPYRSDLFVVTESGITYLEGPGFDVRGLAAQRGQASRLRLMDDKGQVFGSDDEGKTWGRIGAVPMVTEGTLKQAAFGGPALDRVIVAMLGGAYASADGGRRWEQAQGLSSSSANIFSVAVSPVDDRIIWAEGIDLGEKGDLEGRHLFISRDGGVHFEIVLTASADVTLPNGIPMLPHPVDPEVLYYTWGTAFQGTGTKIYRVNARDKSVTFTKNRYHRIQSLIASPADASLLYLGLSNEQIDLAGAPARAPAFRHPAANGERRR